MPEKRFNGRWIKLVARLGAAVVEHPDILDAIEGMIGVGGAGPLAIEQQPRALLEPLPPGWAVAQQKPKKERVKRAAGKAANEVDATQLQSVVDAAVATHGEVSKIVASIRNQLGDVPPKAIATALAAAGHSVKPNYISILLCKLRKADA